MSIVDGASSARNTNVVPALLLRNIVGVRSGSGTARMMRSQSHLIFKEPDMHKRKILIVIGVVTAAASAGAFKDFDFGLFREHQLDAHSEQLFGIVSPIDASSTDSITAQQANADPTALVTLARGLQARVLTARSNAGADIDMMALWPNGQNATHLIACNEEGTTQPGIQRIRLSDGLVETILTGTDS